MGVRLRIHLRLYGKCRSNAHTHIVNVQLKSKWRKMWIGWKMTLSLSLWNGVLGASSSRTRQSAIARKSRSPHILITLKYIIPLYFCFYIITHHLIRCWSLPMRKRFGAISTIITFTRFMCSGLNAVHIRPSVSCLSYFLLWISVDFFSLFAAATIKRKSRETFSSRPNIKSVKMDPLFFS